MSITETLIKEIYNYTAVATFIPRVQLIRTRMQSKFKKISTCDKNIKLTKS